MTIPLFLVGVPNYGWNYPITVILILAGIVKLWFSNFGWNYPYYGWGYSNYG
jgi:hypothetical protein